MRNNRTNTIINLFLHIAFWVLLIVILNSSILGLEWGLFSQELGTFLQPLLYGMTINATLFYINSYKIIPSFLNKKKYKAFWIWSLVLLVGFTFLEIVLDVIYISNSEVLRNIEGYELNFKSLSHNASPLDIIIFVSSTFLINIFYWALAFLYRFPKDWNKNERLKQQLIQDKLTAELDFLKAQINPHFLFNGINSVYHLIGENDEIAKNVLLQFSELLRYQLYECKGELILLQKELNYVNNYILLEEVRKGEDATIRKNLPNLDDITNCNSLKIAPLLLTPFLENAFKYLSLFSEKEKNIIAVEIKIKDDMFLFHVKNSIDVSAINHQNKKNSGIGLENVKRRLKLLYPEKHTLEIKKENECFIVNLALDLS